MSQQRYSDTHFYPLPPHTTYNIYDASLQYDTGEMTLAQQFEELESFCRPEKSMSITDL